MKLIKGTLYLTWSEMMAFGYSDGYLKKVTNEARNGNARTYTTIKDPEDGRRSLIDYDSIPESSKLNRNLPPKDQLLKEHAATQLASLIKTDPKAFDLYYDSPASQHATDLQLIAAYMMLCAPMNRSGARALGYSSINDFYTDVITLLNNKKDLHGWNVKNLDRFKRKLQPFTRYVKTHPSHFDPADPDYYYTNTRLHPAYKDALQSLISKKYGTRNHSKLVKRDDNDTQAEEQQATIIRLYSDPKKLNFEQTWLNYMQYAEQMVKSGKWTDTTADGEPRAYMTQQTLKNFLLRPDIRQVWYQKRHGKKPAADVFTPVTKRRAASFANAKWVIDGTPIHMYFQGRDPKTGKIRAYNRINVFFVMDEHSWAIVGYSISLSENTDQVLAALRDACQRTGMMPWEIQSDNSKPIQSWHVQQAMHKISEYYTPAAAGNARSKRIEPFLKHFNDRILKFKPGYMGNPFASLDHQPNQDVLLQQVQGKQLPIMTDAIRILEESFEEWNFHRFNGAQPEVKYRQSLKETKTRQRQFTPRLDVEAFWHTPGRMKQVPDTTGSSRKMISVFEPTEYTYSAKGITVERRDPLTNDLEKYHFDVPDAEFNSRRILDRFTLKIDPGTWDRALIYKDGRPVLDTGQQPVFAQRKIEQASARVDATPDERMQLATSLANKKRQTELSEERFNRFMEVAASNGHTAPIETSHVYGKEISTGARAEHAERLANRQTVITGGDYLPEPEDNEPVNDNLKRF